MIYDNYISIKLEGKKHLKSRKDFAVSFFKEGVFLLCFTNVFMFGFFFGQVVPGPRDQSHAPCSGSMES